MPFSWTASESALQRTARGETPALFECLTEVVTQHTCVVDRMLLHTIRNSSPFKKETLDKQHVSETVHSAFTVVPFSCYFTFKFNWMFSIWTRFLLTLVMQLVWQRTQWNLITRPDFFKKILFSKKVQCIERSVDSRKTFWPRFFAFECFERLLFAAGAVGDASPWFSKIVSECADLP